MRVVLPILHLEALAAKRCATFERQRCERRDIARRSQPQHVRHPTLRKGAEPVQDHIEPRGPVRDRRHHLKCGRSPILIDLSEEVHREMQRLRSCPAHLGDALAKMLLQPLRLKESRLVDGNCEEAPHPAGCGVAVA